MMLVLVSIVYAIISSGHVQAEVKMKQLGYVTEYSETHKRFETQHKLVIPGSLIHAGTRCSEDTHTMDGLWSDAHTNEELPSGYTTCDIRNSILEVELHWTEHRKTHFVRVMIPEGEMS